MSKLTDAQREEIKLRYIPNQNSAELAREYGVASYKVIWQIVNKG